MVEAADVPISVLGGSLASVKRVDTIRLQRGPGLLPPAPTIWPAATRHTGADPKQLRARQRPADQVAAVCTGASNADGRGRRASPDHRCRATCRCPARLHSHMQLSADFRSGCVKVNRPDCDRGSWRTPSHSGAHMPTGRHTPALSKPLGGTPKYSLSPRSVISSCDHRSPRDKGGEPVRGGNGSCHTCPRGRHRGRDKRSPRRSAWRRGKRLRLLLVVS